MNDFCLPLCQILCLRDICPDICPGSCSILSPDSCFRSLQLQATLNFKSNDLFGFLQSPDLECLGTLAGAWQVADGLPGRRFRCKDVSCGGARLPRPQLKVPSTEPAVSQRGENQAIALIVQTFLVFIGGELLKMGYDGFRGEIFGWKTWAPRSADPADGSLNSPNQTKA